MGLTLKKLMKPIADSDRSIHSHSMTCLCGRAVGIGVDGRVSDHRPRRYGDKGVKLKRKERKSMWCKIPSIISNAILAKNVSIIE